jgi:ribosomal protein S27E
MNLRIIIVLAVAAIVVLAKWLTIKKYLSTAFRVRCPGCDGTGLCKSTAAHGNPHACCRNCGDVYVPSSWVPERFVGSWHDPKKPWSEAGWHWSEYPEQSTTIQYVLIGRGWTRGSLRPLLENGKPRRFPGNPRLSRMTDTKTEYHEAHQETDHAV